MTSIVNVEGIVINQITLNKIVKLNPEVLF